MADQDYSALDTKLTPEEEKQFQLWKQQYAPADSGYDYDLRGAFKAGLIPDAKSGHWSDAFKKPNHPTFSDQSQFAKDYPELAGSWSGETYIKPKPMTEFERRKRKDELYNPPEKDF